MCIYERKLHDVLASSTLQIQCRPHLSANATEPTLFFLYALQVMLHTHTDMAGGMCEGQEP